MNRTEFIIATAAVLFVVFCLGWFAHWLVHRFIRVPASDDGDLERLAEELHEAEETRDQAITYLQQREAELTSELARARGGAVGHDGGVARRALRGRTAAHHLDRVTDRTSG